MVKDDDPQEAPEPSAMVLPTFDRNEAILDSVAAVSALVPLLGGPVSNILSGVSSDRRFERMKAVLLKLARKLDEMGVAQSDYVRSEDFEDLLVEGLERVMRERSSEKRALYTNILSNSVLKPNLDYDEKISFLRTLDALQPRDIAVLKGFLATGKPMRGSFAGSARGVLLELLSDLAPADVDQSLDTLERVGILKGVNAIAAINVSDAQTRLRGFLTSYGDALTAFLSEPPSAH
jgi:hypothetical protein